MNPREIREILDKVERNFAWILFAWAFVLSIILIGAVIYVVGKVW